MKAKDLGLNTEKQKKKREKPETKFYKKLCRLKQFPGTHERIENMAGSGQPDVSGACFLDYWVELKSCRSKPLPVEKLLRPSQKGWFLRRLPKGTLAFVAVERDEELIEVCYDIAMLPDGKVVYSTKILPVWSLKKYIIEAINEKRN